MISSSLSAIVNLFRQNEPSKNLFNEVVLMTLARATSSDSNIKDIEIEHVKQVLLQTTGVEVPNAQIRVAANSHIFESAPIDKYLSRASSELSFDQKLTLLKALVGVIQADERVTSREISFFNSVAKALHVTPAEAMGLKIQD